MDRRTADVRTLALCRDVDTDEMKHCSHCQFPGLHSLGKEHQISLPGIHVFRPDSQRRTADVRAGVEK